jgi:hypothetical protein
MEAGMQRDRYVVDFHLSWNRAIDIEQLMVNQPTASSTSER